MLETKADSFSFKKYSGSCGSSLRSESKMPPPSERTLRKAGPCGRDQPPRARDAQHGTTTLSRGQAACAGYALIGSGRSNAIEPSAIIRPLRVTEIDRAVTQR